MTNRLLQYFKEHKNIVRVTSYFFILTVGFLDYITGYRLGFSIFYLIPISLIVWFFGIREGILISGIGTIIWFLADSAARGDEYDLFILIWNSSVRMGFFLTVTVVLANLRLSLERERRLARTDFLTGIANNQSFMEFVNEEIQRQKRHKKSLTLVYMDCDRFKFINDSFGHEEGNRLLKEIAKTMKNSIRLVDKVGRLGGDEFLLLLPETGTEESKNVVSRVQQELLRTMQDNNWDVTFSIGVATFIVPLESATEMISFTDKVMYAAKNKGKNCIIFETFTGNEKSEA